MSLCRSVGKSQRRKRTAFATGSCKMTTRRRKSLSQRTAPRQKSFAEETTKLMDSNSTLNNFRAPLEEIHPITHNSVEDTPPGLNWFSNSVVRQSKPRPCPLPRFSWADSEELWEYLLQKDGSYNIDPEYLDKQHSILTPRMRAILLDWLIEVSEVYKLHRETFYLAAYYLDRFLACQHNVAKEKLQLIGVTALFIAAKVEEIYPPKLTDFAYVTDGACSEEQILDMEIIVIEALEWVLLPMTPNAWLTLFLQLTNMAGMKEPSKNFVRPKYSAREFIRIIQLLDLCVLDIGSLQYTSSVLAASALYLVLNDDFQWKMTGQSWEIIGRCVQWMLPFYAVLNEKVFLSVKDMDKLSKDNVHNIQTHVNGLGLLDKVATVPHLPVLPPGVDIPTPPGSTQK